LGYQASQTPGQQSLDIVDDTQTARQFFGAASTVAVAAAAAAPDYGSQDDSLMLLQSNQETQCKYPPCESLMIGC
jgi:hypothetical protein